MKTHSLFKYSPFEPEQIEVLVSAYEAALRTLGLRDRGDPFSEMVARQVIAIAQTGVRDPRLIAMRAARDLGVPDPQ
jgi:hypothetical protein